MSYNPRPGSMAYRALQILDEQGAQYSADLTAKLGIGRYDLKDQLRHAITAGFVDRERRVLNGRTCCVWFVTPAAFPLLDQIAKASARHAAEGVA